jgi:hypothetical protein
LILEELRKVGVKVEPHSAWFRHNTEDTEWLAVVGEKKWVVLMRDKAIGRHPLELDALLGARVKAFVLTRGELSASETATILINAMPHMLSTIEENRFPFIAKIYQDGSVGVWKTEPIRQKGRKSKGRHRPIQEKKDEAA